MTDFLYLNITLVGFLHADPETLRVRREAVFKKLRYKRQLEEAAANATASQTTTTESIDVTTTAPNDTSNSSNSNEDTLKKVFNYADFTRAAGWQLVDDYSNHSSPEPRTLLKCMFRGKQCDSRVCMKYFAVFLGYFIPAPIDLGTKHQ